jgi:hypothetical protein
VTLRQFFIGAATGVAVVLLSTVGLVCSVLLWGSVEDAGGDRIEPLPGVPPVTLPAKRAVYVALGDSYSSGEGVRPFVDGTGDPGDGGDNCHRSKDAYALQIVFTTRVERRFRACSGARIADMYARQQTDGGGSRLGAQLAPGVLGPEVGLVTLTIGGNDLGFANVLHHCAVHAHCMDDKFDDSFDDGRKSELTLRVWADRKLVSVIAQTGDLLARVGRDAPNARIVVLGYPNLFWTSWPDTQAKDCILQQVFGLQEVNPLLHLQHRMSLGVAEAAARVGADFIWAAPIFEGHEPCGAITPRWLDFVPLRDLGAGHPRIDPGAMHPNRNGHYILSRAISCYLAQNPRPTASYDGKALKDCARYGTRQ